MRRSGYLLWACALCLPGCADFGWIDLRFQPDKDLADTGAARLRRIQSTEQWTTFFVEQVSAQQQRFLEPGCAEFFGFGEDRDAVPLLGEPGGLAPPGPVGDQATDGDAAAPDSGASEGGSNQTEFTGTNLQEIGVDEADVVKTDGTYFYLLVGSELRIVRAYPLGDMAELAALELDAADYSTSHLYLRGDRLVVITQPSYLFYVDGPAPIAVDGDVAFAPYYENDKTVVTLVDVSDRSNPAVEAKWQFDGYYSDSRMIDGMLHLVISQYPYIPYDFDPQTLTTADVAQFIPKYTVAIGQAPERSGELVAFGDFYRPEDPDGYSMTTIVSLDTNQVTDEFSSVAIMADTGTIYASREALYLTDPDYNYYCDYRETLDIHKFAFTAEGAEYTASGSVEGRLLNQFSLGEYDAYLRVATTTGQPWAWNAATSQNHVFVLGQRGDELPAVGAIENIAPGEQIYSARFMGDKGFLVTFRQVDPLFTLDLSQPTDPAVMGELKVPGFSEYIHIMDEDHLLTLGRDATEQGQVLGLQLSIFDVSDLADPQLLTVKKIGASGTYSEAEYNHKAFTYYAAENLLAIPVDLYESTQQLDYGQYTFSGVQVYRVTPEEGIELRGQIPTSDADQFGYPVYWGWSRGIFIEEQIYAVSEIGVHAAAIDAPSAVLSSVELKGSPYGEGGGGVIEVVAD